MNMGKCEAMIPRRALFSSHLYLSSNIKLTLIDLLRIVGNNSIIVINHFP